MLQINEFVIGFIVGILAALFLFGSRMYVHYKEKKLLDDRIKRLEKANSINVQSAELSTNYQQLAG